MFLVDLIIRACVCAGAESATWFKLIIVLHVAPGLMNSLWNAYAFSCKNKLSKVLRKWVSNIGYKVLSCSNTKTRPLSFEVVCPIKIGKLCSLKVYRDDWVSWAKPGHYSRWLVWLAALGANLQGILSETCEKISDFLDVHIIDIFCLF